MNLTQLAKLQTLKKHLENFRNNHPKFPRFLDAVYRDALEEGSLIEIRVTSPEGKNYVTNLRVQKEDLDFLKALSDLNHM